MPQTYQDRPTLEQWNALTGSVPRIVTGTYTGDGQASKQIELGFVPTAVYVCRKDGATVYTESSTTYHYGGLALSGYPATTKYWRRTTIAINGSGFYVCRVVDEREIIDTNDNGMLYHYVALG